MPEGAHPDQFKGEIQTLERPYQHRKTVGTRCAKLMEPGRQSFVGEGHGAFISWGTQIVLEVYLDRNPSLS